MATKTKFTARTVSKSRPVSARAASDTAVLSPTATKALVVFLLAILVYVPAMWGGFIWDDDQLLTANPTMPDPWGLFKLWLLPVPWWSPHLGFHIAAWSQPLVADYFPLTSSTFWLEYRLWGVTTPGGYHITNVILHAVDCVLIMVVLQRLRIPGAWLAALLFAVHPVNAESVAWISERKNTLSMVFYLLTFLAYLDYEDRPKPRTYAIALVLFFLALTAKTTVVTLPFLLLLIAWWRRGRITKEDFRNSVPFFGVSILMGLVTLYFQYVRAIGTEVIAIGGFFSRLAGAGMAVWFYLGKILWPFNLIEIYPHWDIDPPQAWMFLPGIGLTVLFYILWLARNRWGRAPLFALSYFVITLAPVLGFMKMSYMRLTLVADHFQYVPMIGILALLAAGGAMLWDWMPWETKPVSVVATACLLGGLSWMTWDRAEVHQTEESLWRDTLDKNPDSWQANNHYGAVLFAKGDVDDAMYHFKRAVELKPDNPEVHNNVALAWATKNHLELAIPEYREAVRIRPDNVPMRTNLANALASSHQFAEAATIYGETVDMEPKDSMLRFNYANILYQAGRTDEAVKQLQESIRLNPNFPPAHQNLDFLLKGGSRPPK